MAGFATQSLGNPRRTYFCFISNSQHIRGRCSVFSIVWLFRSAWSWGGSKNVDSLRVLQDWAEKHCFKGTISTYYNLHNRVTTTFSCLFLFANYP